MFQKQKPLSVLFVIAFITAAFTLTGYAQQQPQKPLAPQSAVINDTVAPLPKVGAALYAHPVSYTGKCPAVITFKGHIAVNKPATIQYTFIRSDGATTPIETITFEKAGAKNVSTIWKLGGHDLTTYSGWQAIKIISPGPKESKKASFSMKCTAPGQTPQAQPGQQGQLPDLAIEEITLNENCFVVVRVKNNGPGMVPDEVWDTHKPESSSVYLMVNGKKWGGETIWHFDAVKALKASGGEATMTSKYKLTGAATITALIDHTQQVKETNKANNKATKKLICKAGTPQSGTTPALGKEDCVSFNPATTTVSQIQGIWKVGDGSHWLFDFGARKDEADKTLAIIKNYNMDRSCFVGRPQPSFSYMLISGAPPVGPFAGEDCVPFNPAAISVQQIKGDWKIVEGSSWLFSFGPNKAEADQTLAIIKKYGFTRSCFVGRPGPSFTYMRK